VSDYDGEKKVVSRATGRLYQQWLSLAAVARDSAGGGGELCGGRLAGRGMVAVCLSWAIMSRDESPPELT